MLSQASLGLRAEKANPYTCERSSDFLVFQRFQDGKGWTCTFPSCISYSVLLVEPGQVVIDGYLHFCQLVVLSHLQQMHIVSHVLVQLLQVLQCLKRTALLHQFHRLLQSSLEGLHLCHYNYYMSHKDKQNQPHQQQKQKQQQPQQQQQSAGKSSKKAQKAAKQEEKAVPKANERKDFTALSTIRIVQEE